MPLKALRLRSPAKLNLYLRILNKRPDGYHSIVTLFERIDLCDDIVLEERPSGIRIICDNPKVPEGAGNLAYKAARSLLDYAGVEKGVLIKIKKRIPVEAGLGGGSSNAAVVLAGLNSLWNLKLSQKGLMKIGAKIGADVNFFLLDKKFAVGTQKGEQLDPLKLSNTLWHILIVSRRGLSTNEIYGLWDKFSHAKITLTAVMRDVKIIQYSIQKNDLVLLGKNLHNDLEQPAQIKDKTIQKAKDLLKSSGITGFLMSGSGPSVFGIVSSRKEAMTARQKLNCLQDACQIFVAKTY